MRNLLLGLLLAFTLVALGQAKAMPKAWPFAVKGGVKGATIQQIPTHPDRPIEVIVVEPEISTLDLESDYDDKTKDPDWLPPDDVSYYEDSNEHSDSAYDEEEEEPAQEGDIDLDSYDDEIWSSDDDPDYVPEEDDDLEEDDDDHDTSDHDPDYIPQYSQEDDEESYEEDEQAADDVDDTADGDDFYDSEEDKADQLDAVLLQIAILELEKEDPEGINPDKTENYFQFMKQLDLTLEEAERFLSFLLTVDDSVNKVDTEVDEYDDHDTSDHDPDYIPTHHSQEDDEEAYDEVKDDVDNTADEEDLYDYDEYKDDRLDEILLDIAMLQAERLDPDGVEPDKIDGILEALKLLDLSIEDAERMFTYVKTHEDSANEVDIGALLQQQQAPSVKGKRQTKSLGAYSQQHQPGQTQQSGQIHYEVGQPGHIIGVDQGPYHLEDGQINHISHTQREPVVSVIQHPDHADVADGVVPLGAVAGGSSHGVSQGVESVDEEAESDSSFVGWLGAGWDHISNAADTVSDHVEDKVDVWGDSISGAFDTVHDVASDAVDKVQDAASYAADSIHDAAHSAGESIVSTYHKVKGKIPELRERIRNLFTSFSLMVQQGADYCIYHMGNAVDKVREAEVLDKLQQKLAEGNEEVTQFFTLLGEKVNSWRQSQGHTNVDSGLIIVDAHHPQGHTYGEHNVDASGGDREQAIPNLFQDQDIVVQLNQMVSSGVITQDDFDMLSQQTTQEVDFVQDPYQQDSSAPVIQVQASRRLRSRVRRHHHGRH